MVATGCSGVWAIPMTSDPRWPEYLSRLTNVPLHFLPVKIMATRVKLMNWAESETRKKEAIEIVRDFFIKNEAMAQSDGLSIFGGGTL